MNCFNINRKYKAVASPDIPAQIMQSYICIVNPCTPEISRKLRSLIWLLDGITGMGTFLPMTYMKEEYILKKPHKTCALFSGLQLYK